MPVDGYLNFDTKIDTDGFQDGVKDVEKQVDMFRSSLGGVAKKIKTAFNVAAVAAFGKASIKAAAEVKAAGSQFEQTFGDMQDAANAAIDRVADPADILAERLRGSATSIYAFAKTAKMETDTAMNFMERSLRAAADSAAYYDRSIEDTTATLQSFLKGNYENDAALGLSATEATRNAKAMALYGKKFKDLSEAQKQLTLLSMVEEANALSGAMGQAAREAEGWENVTGNLSEAWNQFLGIVGQPLLALAVPVVQQMTAALERMTAWATAAYTALAQVFGWEQKQVKPIKQAEAAQGDLTAAVEETEAAQDGSLASFDEIEVLASDAAKATEQSAQAVEVAAAAEMEAVPAEQREADTAWVDTYTQKLTEFKAFLDTDIRPALATVGQSLKEGFASFGAWLDTELKPALSTVGESLKQGFSDIGAYIDTNIKPALAEISKKYDLTFSVTPPEGLGELFTPVADWLENRFPEIVKNTIGKAVELFDPLARWFAEDLPGFVSSGIEFASTVVLGLLDTFAKVFADITSSVIEPFLSSFAESILPTFTELGTQLFDALTIAFKEVKQAFDMAWEDAIKPVLDFIGKAWSDAWELMREKWKQWGEPIFEKLKEAFENAGKNFEKIWKNMIKPVWDTFMEVVNKLWENHLKPFIGNFLDLIGTIIDGALDIYNKFITPVIGWIADNLGPAWANIKKIIIETVGAILGNIIDFGSSIIDAFKGIIDFVVGVFTGDWKRAWEGIKSFVGGIWDGIKNLLKAAINAIIGFINGMLSGVVNGMNRVVRALNSISFTIPDWVPFYGGERFGLNLRTISAPQIPYLAEGAVIPPNREFLAVLGDQHDGVNIETPLETMLEAFRTALRENGGGHGQQTIILQVDKRELGRVVLEVGNEEERRIGLRMVTA